MPMMDRDKQNELPQLEVRAVCLGSQVWAGDPSLANTHLLTVITLSVFGIICFCFACLFCMIVCNFCP